MGVVTQIRDLDNTSKTKPYKIIGKAILEIESLDFFLCLEKPEKSVIIKDSTQK